MANIFDEIEAEEVNPYDEIEAAPAPAAPAVRQPTQIRTPPDLLSGRQEVLGVFGGGRDEIGDDVLTARNVVRRGIADPVISLAKGTIGVGESVVGLADIPTLGAAGKILESTVGYDPKTAKKWLEEFYSPEQKAANELIARSKGFGGTLKTSLENPSTIAHTLIESTPQMLGGAAAGRKLISKYPKIGGKIGTTGGAVIGEGAVAAGSHAEQTRQQSKSGFLTPKQAALSTTTGLTTALISLLGGKIARKIGADDIDVLLTAGGKSTPAAKQAALSKIFKGAISEGLFEELPQSALEQIQSNLANDRPWSEGVPESSAQGFVAGLVMGGGINAVDVGGRADPSLTLDEDIVSAPELTAEQIEQQAIKPATPQRRVGVRIPEGEFAQPGVLELADEAMREAQSPIHVPGQVPAIERLRNAVNPPKMVEAGTKPKQVTREAGESVVAPRLQGLEVTPGFERTADDKLLERQRTELAPEEQQALSEFLAEETKAGRSYPPAPYRQPRTPDPRQGSRARRQAELEAGLESESGQYLDEPFNQTLPEPTPTAPPPGTTLVNPATGRRIVKPTVLSNLQKQRLRKALERGADETTLRNIMRVKEPESDPSLSLAPAGDISPDAIAAMPAEEYFNTSRGWAQESMAGRGVPPQIQAELAAIRNPDIEKWRQGRAKAVQEAEAVRDEVRQNPASISNPAVQARVSGAGMKAQFFSEGLKILEGTEPDARTKAALQQRESLNQTAEPQTYEMPASIPVEKTQEVVARFKQDYPGARPVKIARDHNEMPESVHQASYSQGGYPWLVNAAVTADGEVWINAANMTSEAQVIEELLHENAGHWATDKQLGAKLNKFMGQVADSFDKHELMAEVKSAYGKGDKVRHGREFVARLAQNPQAAPNAWKRLVAQFRDWLRSIGWVKTVSENDIRVLLNRSMENLRKKEAGATDEQISFSFNGGKLPGDQILTRRYQGFDISQIDPKTGKRIGHLQIDFSPDGEAVIKAVDVDEKNTRKGIATQMYENAKRELSKHGITKVKGALEGSGPVQIREKVFGAGNTKYFSGGSEISTDEAIKIMDVDYGRVLAESIIPKSELNQEELNLSLRSAAEVAASRFPETPPTPAAPAAKAEPASTPPATGVKPNLDAVYKIFEPAKKTGPGLKQRGIDLIESVRTGFSSKFRPLNKLAQDIAKAYGRTSPKDVAGIFEQLNGSQGKAEADIYRFDQAVSKLVEGDEKDFSPYMFLRRSLDRLNQDAADIERAVAGEGVKKLNRRAVAGYTIPQLEADLAALEQKLGPEKVSKFEQAAELYQQHMDAALRLQVESGRMSQKVYDAIKEDNQFYAPFKVMKYLEETSQPEGSGRRVDTLADFTKAMEGIEDSDFRLGDMLAAARQSILMSRILADKNTAMRNVSELAAFDPDGMFIRRLKDGQKPQRGFEAVNVLEAGKPVRYEVNQDVAKALQIYGSTGADMFTRALSLASIPFRAGATALNLPFQVSNLMADTPRAALVSKYGVRRVQDMIQYPLDFVQALYSSISGDVFGKENKLFLDFLDSGVAGSTIQEYLTPEALKFKEPTNISKSRKLAESVINTIPRFAKAIEQTNKVLGVKRAMRIEGVESGKQLAQQVPEAITELRRFSGSPDFGRMGRTVDQYRLNIILMFLNARIQGAIADVGRLGGRDGGKVAAQTWLKLGMPVAIATAFLYALNNRDEYKEDYEQRPDQEKENYWLIPKDSYITNDQGERMRDYWRIPKREISKWVANMTEQALDFAKRRDPKALTDFGVRMAEELTPVNITGDTLQERTESVLSGLNPLLKMPLELGTGRSFYRHQDIIPENMKDASPESQFKPRTAEAFKKLGEAMPDFMPEALRSPLILENLTQNLTAGMITQFLPTPPVEGRSKLENTPLLRRFQAVPYTDDGGEQEMLDELKREAADERLKRHREATSLIDSNPGKPLGEILKMAPRDEKFLNHFADLWVAKENGITGRERQIIALPVRQRAAYVADQLSRLEGEAKQLKFQELARKRILTEAVYQELPNVMK